MLAVNTTSLTLSKLLPPLSKNKQYHHLLDFVNGNIIICILNINRFKFAFTKRCDHLA